MSVIRQLSLLIAMTGTALGAQAATAARSVAGKAKAESDGQDWSRRSSNARRKVSRRPC